MSDITRKLASVQKITGITPIPKADKICSYTVEGWNVVDSIGKYQVGDRVVFLEIDSWVPHELAPFLSNGQEPKEYKGVRGERLRTVKLRGSLSQGLLLPINDNFDISSLSEGMDLTENLGIHKWEAPLPASLQGEVRGVFPSYLPKTDEERVQNLLEQFGEWKKENLSWEVTEKLDGTSCTIYYNNGVFGVCSRNLDLKPSENTYWKIAQKYNLENLLAELNINIAIQGEIIGEGIQGNKYKLKGQDFYVFNIYDMTEHDYMRPDAREYLVNYLGLKMVPKVCVTSSEDLDSVDNILSLSQGKSFLNAETEREGLVFKCLERHASFKAVSNRSLLEEKE